MKSEERKCVVRVQKRPANVQYAKKCCFFFADSGKTLIFATDTESTDQLYFVINPSTILVINRSAYED